MRGSVGSPCLFYVWLFLMSSIEDGASALDLQGVLGLGRNWLVEYLPSGMTVGGPASRQMDDIQHFLLADPNAVLEFQSPGDVGR